MLAVVALLLSGCPPAQNGKSGSAPAEKVALEDGGSITLPLTIASDQGAVQSLDFSEPALWALARCIELPVLQARPDGTTAPGAALECESTDGGTTYVLKLSTAPGHESDPGYLGRLLIEHWQLILRGRDGPLKAQLADLMEGGTAYAQGQGDSLSGLKLADWELTVQLTRPYQLFPLWLSQPGLGVMAVRQLPAEGGEAAGGWGPFKAVSFAERKITLEANPDSILGQPRLDRLSFICEPDRMMQVELFRGEVLDAANVPMLNVADVAMDGELERHLKQNATACQIVGSFDHHQFPWGDQEFQPKTGLRQAMNWGLSRGLLAEVFSGQVSSWPHFLPESMSDAVDPALVSNPMFPNHQLIEDARAALKKADHEQGSKLLPGMDLAYLRDSDLDRLADEILHYWVEISVKMEPFPLTREELRTRLELGTTEIVLERMPAAYPDPDALFYPALFGPLAYRNGQSNALTGLGGNHSLLADQQVDALIAAMQAEQDATARTRLYQQLGKLLEERAMFVFVGTATPSLLLGARLGGYELNPYDFDASLPGQDFSKLGIKAGADGTQIPKQANAEP